jgi:hypothetical protein
LRAESKGLTDLAFGVESFSNLRHSAASWVLGIERPASSLAHPAVLGRMAFPRGSFLRASLLRALTRHAIANCLLGFSSLVGLVGSDFLMAFLDKKCLDALQGVIHGSRGFRDCGACQAVLVPPRRNVDGFLEGLLPMVNALW